uniref:Uncharacterized protein n=1 Tax=Hemiselmis andersenii TaxID=464988 RepID=A0A6U4N5Z8_HEMAN|mmetsp:Transcript_21284/g.49333  ORF Transcript_21284/g.49333 Transcript_21284/m.49333 type:complete len:142 (+) Transcript_21284:57-482(+)
MWTNPFSSSKSSSASTDPILVRMRRRLSLPSTPRVRLPSLRQVRRTSQTSEQSGEDCYTEGHSLSQNHDNLNARSFCCSFTEVKRDGTLVHRSITYANKLNSLFDSFERDPLRPEDAEMAKIKWRDTVKRTMQQHAQDMEA